MHVFTKTGSGQTQGKLKKEWRFSQAHAARYAEFGEWKRGAENARLF